MGSTIKLLIADDQQTFREVIRDRLQKESDIQVVGEASSGEEVLPLVKETQPTLVI